MVNYGCYRIKDSFFERFTDPYLKGNKKESRPHYYCFADKEVRGLYWVIPMSHKIDKVQRIIDDRTAKHKPCDILHIININGDKSAFLIQDMFPITDDYIERPYTINGVHLIIKDLTDIEAIRRKANNVYRLIHSHVKLNPTQPNVLFIKNKLIENLKINL